MNKLGVTILSATDVIVCPSATKNRHFGHFARFPKFFRRPPVRGNPEAWPWGRRGGRLSTPLPLRGRFQSAPTMFRSSLLTSSAPTMCPKSRSFRPHCSSTRSRARRWDRQESTLQSSAPALFWIRLPLPSTFLRTLVGMSLDFEMGSPVRARHQREPSMERTRPPFPVRRE